MGTGDTMSNHVIKDPVAQETAKTQQQPVLRVATSRAVPAAGIEDPVVSVLREELRNTREEARADRKETREGFRAVAKSLDGLGATFEKANVRAHRNQFITNLVLVFALVGLAGGSLYLKWAGMTLSTDPVSARQVIAGTSERK